MTSKTELKAAALSFLEFQALAAADALPRIKGDVYDTVIDRLEAKEAEFIGWMLERPEWAEIMSDYMYLSEKNIKACFADPAAFAKMVRATLFEYFHDVLTDFEQDVMNVLIRENYIDVDTDPHDTCEAGGLRFA
jgi:hypothetical protein